MAVCNSEIFNCDKVFFSKQFVSFALRLRYCIVFHAIVAWIANHFEISLEPRTIYHLISSLAFHATLVLVFMSYNILSDGRMRGIHINITQLRAEAEVG